MRVAAKGNITKPFTSPLGEIVFELIGASEASGGAKTHSLAIVVIPPGKSSALHHHIVSEETYYILKGVARMVIDDQVFQLEPGHACLIEPFEQHQIFNAGDDDLEFIAICAPPWVPDDSVFA
jgi:mannose-6-phosphate isomerase-like protein (cupin superfamily)